MSDTTLVTLAVLAAMLVGYLIGLVHGWALGKRWGEADGVRWARERLEDENRMRAKDLGR